MGGRAEGRFSSAVKEVDAWPFWKMSPDVRSQLAALHGIALPADLNVTVGAWLASVRKKEKHRGR